MVLLLFTEVLVRGVQRRGGQWAPVSCALPHEQPRLVRNGQSITAHRKVLRRSPPPRVSTLQQYVAPIIAHCRQTEREKERVDRQ